MANKVLRGLAIASFVFALCLVGNLAPNKTAKELITDNG